MFDPDVRQSTFCLAAQTIKTTLMMLGMAFAIVCDPGPAMFVTANEKLAKRFSRKRWRPFCQSSPGMAHVLTRRREDFGLLEQKFTTASLSLVGAGSPANVSSDPIKHLFGDEVDKYPDATDDEASAKELAMKRARSYDGARITWGSTPTTEDGEIWRLLLASDFRRWYTPCLKCGEPFVAEHELLRWPRAAKRADGTWDLRRVLAETRLVCPHCGHGHGDGDKPALNAAGRWIATQEGEPGHAGFHFPAFMATWASCDFGRHAIDFLQKKDRAGKLQDYVNSTEALPWRGLGKSPTVDAILLHRVGYAPGHCPEMPLRVFATVDVQADRFYFVVRAWCLGERSYLVDYGCVATLADLKDRLSRAVQTPAGLVNVSHVYIDSGDDTDEVYRICRQNGWRPTKGEGGTRRPETYWHGKGKNGEKLLMFRVDAFKDALVRRMGKPVDSRGAWLLHAETDVEYAAQVAGERKVDAVDRHNQPRSYWRKVGENHYLDCEVMQLVVAEYHRIRNLIEPAPARPPGDPAAPIAFREPPVDREREDAGARRRALRVRSRLRVQQGGE